MLELVAGLDFLLRTDAAELGVSHWNLRDWTKGHNRMKPVAPVTAQEFLRA